MEEEGNFKKEEEDQGCVNEPNFLENPAGNERLTSRRKIKSKPNKTEFYDFDNGQQNDSALRKLFIKSNKKKLKAVHDYEELNLGEEYFHVKKELKDDNNEVLQNINDTDERKSDADYQSYQKCKHCQKSIKTTSLKLHIANNHKPRTCEICNETFLKARLLKEHIEFFHNKTDVKQTCQYCQKCIKSTCMLAHINAGIYIIIRLRFHVFL